MKRLIFLVCFALGALAVAPAPSVAATPPATLSGENLFATGGPVSVQCSAAAAGTSQTFSYTVSGVAAGPYLGTFTETGTGTVFQPPVIPGSPPVYPIGQVTAFSASFTIYSPAGDVLVKGTKTLDTTVPNTSIGCLNPPELGSGSINTTYEATIYTPSGNYRDEGTSYIAVLFSDPGGTTLSESFASSLFEPVLLVPTSKADCKHGGWRNYPQFKNEGDCNSFVATGGKNPPDGP